jgi:hypothetical protein
VKKQLKISDSILANSFLLGLASFIFYKGGKAMLGNYYMLHYIPTIGNVFHYYDTTRDALEAIQGKYQRSLNKSFLWMFARQENNLWLEMEYDDAIPYLTEKIEMEKIAANILRLERELEPLINTSVPKISKSLENMRNMGMNDEHEWVIEKSKDLKDVHEKIEKLRLDILTLQKGDLPQ